MLSAQKNGKEIDATLSRIEQSVNTLYDIVLRELDDPDTFRTSKAYVDAYTKKMENILFLLKYLVQIFQIDRFFIVEGEE